MKNSTKKILLLLYSGESNANLNLAVSDLPLLLPELTPAGIRSLVHWWQLHGLVNQILNQGQKVLISTQNGRLMLAKVMPAIAPNLAPQADIPSKKPTAGYILILNHAPSFDPGFRRLRSLIRTTQGLLVGRGSYALPTNFNLNLRQTLFSKYSGNISLIEVGQWLIGSYKDLLLRQPSLMDGLESYSGISKELELLLIKSSGKKGLIYRYKKQYYSLYDRFYLIVCENRGIITQFLPTDHQPEYLLRQFQTILRNSLSTDLGDK